MKRDDGGLAFGGTRTERIEYSPEALKAMNEGERANRLQWGERHHPGMSLRDYFASSSLAAIIAASAVPDCGVNRAVCPSPRAQPDVSVCSNLAYLFADAMLAERARIDRAEET